MWDAVLSRDYMEHCSKVLDVFALVNLLFSFFDSSPLWLLKCQGFACSWALKTKEASKSVCSLI